MVSSSTSHPWSDIKAEAQAFLAGSLGTYGFNGGSPLGDPQELQNQMAQLMGVNALLFTLNQASASSATYKNNIIGMLDDFNDLWANELAAPEEYRANVPMNGAFFSAVIALDVIHPELTAGQRTTYETMFSSYTTWNNSHHSSWQLANYGATAIWAVYMSTDSAFVQTSTAIYHNGILYPGDTLPMLNQNGGFAGGALYGWDRLGGGSLEKISKWGFKYVAQHTGVDAFYANEHMKNYYEWQYAGFTNPFLWRTCFGDTNHHYSLGNDFWHGQTGSSHTLTSSDLTVGNWSPRAAGWAARLANLSTKPLQYPDSLLVYRAATAPLSISTPSVSFVLQNQGAAFWDEDQSTAALQGIMWNAKQSRYDHIHKEQNNLYLVGYGEVLLAGPGYFFNSPLAGFPVSWSNDNAVSHNVALIGNQDHVSNLRPDQLHATAGGDGIPEHILGSYFDYASAFSSSAYGLMGSHYRNFLFVHPSDSVQGYWVSMDEVNSSTYSSVNILWHPYALNFTTTTAATEWAWPIADHNTSTTTLNVFLGTPQTSVTFSSGVFAGRGGGSNLGMYMNALYNVDASSNVRAVTVLYPSNTTHSKSTMTRLAPSGATGAAVLSGASTTDYILISSPSANVTQAGATYRGRGSFFRTISGALKSFFVRQGYSFDDGASPRKGFATGVPVSFYMRDYSGTIYSTASVLTTFYYPNISGVYIDGVLTSGTRGSNSYAVTIASGTHSVYFSTSSAINLSTFWSEDGGYKMARQDTLPYPSCSTCTISRLWDGRTINLMGGKGELLSWVTYLIAGSSDATNVMVTISSFTGTGTAAGYGFSSIQVSSSNVWDYSGRPYSLYKYGYLQVLGTNNAEANWDPTEYEMRQTPLRWRTPYTVDGENRGLADSGQKLWVNRPDHDKFYPDIALPMELFAISSFTVAASSSQAIGGEVYIDTALRSGVYTSTLTVYEGTSISTQIPIHLRVRNVTLPAISTMPVIGALGLSDLSGRIHGEQFPADKFVEPYLTTELRAAAFLRRHKIIPIGDEPADGQNFPSAAYQKHIDGSAYTSTYGYGAAPGYGVGDPFYMIGAYGSWRSVNWSTTTTSGASGYCTNVSSWTAYCTNNNLDCELYTSQDEASDAVLADEVDILSTWTSTAPACAHNGNRMDYFQTANLPDAATLAPYVNSVASVDWLGFSTATWQSLETLYQTSSTHSVWGYNQQVGTNGTFPLQEAGMGPRIVLWGAYKTGQKGWFLWHVNYWQDGNNGNQPQNGYNADNDEQNNVFQIAKTFGYDGYPSTSASKGHTGFNFSNSDGVLLYPGTDTVYTDESYGINGVFGSWRLNSLTRGIQDVDLLTMAYAVNPSSTTAIVNNLIYDVMYLRQCYDLEDCSYAYGDRPWYDVNSEPYETARYALYDMLEIPENQPKVLQGRTRLSGRTTLR